MEFQVQTCENSRKQDNIKSKPHINDSCPNFSAAEKITLFD